MLEEHEKLCKSRTGGEWIKSFPHILPTSQMSYYARYPKESAVSCFYEVNLNQTQYFQISMGLPVQ